MLWPLYFRERPGTHCIGGWVGLRAGLDRCGKSRLLPRFDPRTVQPVASRYTDYAIVMYGYYPHTLRIFGPKWKVVVAGWIKWYHEYPYRW
jgi:hypothetical protein